MGKAQDLINLVEMAFSKSQWIDNVRDRYLGGALGEYAKIVIAKQVGIDDYWSDEVRELLSNVNKYMDKNKTSAKSKFNREKAFVEAYSEASTFQFQISDARKELSKGFPDKYKEILKTNGKLTSSDLIKNMVKEYLPKYYGVIENL